MGRVREGGDVWLCNQNLTGLHQERFTDLICQITTDRPFQDKDLDVELGMTLDYASRASAGGRDCSSLDLRAPGAFRYLEKHCTFAETHSTRSMAETDNRFSAETHNRLLCHAQFGPCG